MDAGSVLSAVEIKFYMQFIFRSISKKMVQKFQGAAVCFSRSPLHSYPKNEPVVSKDHHVSPKYSL
jgi:hypothetical protein